MCTEHLACIRHCSRSRHMVIRQTWSLLQKDLRVNRKKTDSKQMNKPKKTYNYMIAVDMYIICK